MNPRSRSSFTLIRIALPAALLLLSGCATMQAGQEADENDPLEGMNRAIYSFNENLDKAVLKPVATGYKAVVPQPLRTGVTNFFNNLAYPTVIINSFLQGKFEQGTDDLMRFITNSSFGLFGLLDVATPAGMPAHNEDFGQSLAKWGVGEGPYLVLPFFGPSNARDTVGLVVDFQTDLLTYHDQIAERNRLWGLKAIDRRANLLSAGRILDEAAPFDPYVFTRDAYRQRRAGLISDNANGANQDFRNDDTEDTTAAPVDPAPVVAPAPADPAPAPTP